MSCVVWSAGTGLVLTAPAGSFRRGEGNPVFPAHKDNGPLCLLPQLHWYQMGTVIVLGSDSCLLCPDDASFWI